MSKKLKLFFVISSILSIANVIFLPVHQKGGGILTENAEYNFVRVIGDAFMEEGALSLWVVQMTLCIFVPSVIMLACGITRMRFLYTVANTAGLLLWFFNISRYALENGVINLFEVEKTDISIGSWVAALIFLINALVLLCTKKKKKQEEAEEEDQEAEEH